MALSGAGGLAALPPAAQLGSPTGVLFVGLAYPAVVLGIRWVRGAVTGNSSPQPGISPSAASLYAMLIVLAGRLALEDYTGPPVPVLISVSVAVALLAASAFGREQLTQFGVHLADRRLKRRLNGALGPLSIAIAFAFNRTRNGPLPRSRWRKWVLPLWCLLVAGLTVWLLTWIWGSPTPTVFISPDESNNRVGAEIVALTGSPLISLPFEDPEDLVHPRFWVSNGLEAFSPHPPATFYIYGAGLNAGPIGWWLPYATSGLGIAALSGAGVLIAARRPQIGALLPVLALPAAYWILRPWSSFSPYLTSISIALVFAILWLTNRRSPLAVAYAISLGIAGLIRPDQMVFLIGGSFLITYLIVRQGWRVIAGLHAAAALGTMSVTAIFNWQTSGNPMMTGYQLSARTIELTSLRDTAALPISTVLYAFAPSGLPRMNDLEIAVEQYVFFAWTDMASFPGGRRTCALPRTANATTDCRRRGIAGRSNWGFCCDTPQLRELRRRRFHRRAGA